MHVSFLSCLISIHWLLLKNSSLSLCAFLMFPRYLYAIALILSFHIFFTIFVLFLTFFPSSFPLFISSVFNFYYYADFLLGCSKYTATLSPMRLKSSFDSVLRALLTALTGNKKKHRYLSFVKNLFTHGLFRPCLIS